MECAAHQRDGVELRVRGCGDPWVVVAEIHRRVRGQAVEITPAIDVGDPGALRGRGDDRQRRVVVRGVAVLDRDCGGGELTGVGRNVHDRLHQRSVVVTQ